MRRGSNLGQLGGFNQLVILDGIRRAAEGVSRIELAHSTGLTTQTVSNIVRRLLEQRLIREDRTTSNGPGKPRTVLELEAGTLYAIGVHIDPAIITFVLLDLRGTVVARATRNMPATPEPTKIVRMMASSIDALVNDAAVDRSKLLGIGIASPGPIDERHGVVVGPPLLEGWTKVPLRQALHEATGLPVLLDKDATAAAVAELWFGSHADRANFAFIYLGTGIGAGLVLGNGVVRGSYNNLGEIGHLCTGEDGPVCDCGRADCVGAATSPRTLVSQAIDAGLMNRDSVDMARPREVRRAYRKLCTSAIASNADARGIIDTAARKLGRAVEDIANLLDLDQVVFGGPMWTPIGDHILTELGPVLNRRFVATAIHDVTLLGSKLGDDVGAIGAASLILNHKLSPDPAGLVLNS